MMISTEQARAIAAMRRVRSKRCPICGVTFQAIGKQRFDSKRCANKASYRRVGRKGHHRSGEPVESRSYELAVAGLMLQAEDARARGDAERAAFFERQAAAVARQAPSPSIE
jgi:hypothetical protein